MKAIKRNLAILLAACLVITSVIPAFAEEIPEQQTETVNEIIPEEATPNEATYGSEAADPENEDIEKASPSDAKKSDSEVFIREATVDGVIVKVEAPAGTFPADAKLSVIAVDEDTVDENIENVEEKIDEAVEAARKKDKDLKDAKVLSSLKFDIKIVLPDGTELQPEGNKVKVTFTLAEKVGDCVDINVYHLKEVENTGNAADTEESDVSLKAEKVEGTVKTVPAEKTAETAEGMTAVNAVSEEVDEEGVLADGPITNDVNDEVSEFEGETDGFSYYTVEFTYEELQYVLPGDSSIALSDILAQLKIEGTVADVEVSSPELFSADKDANGVWTVTAHQAFSSEEWLKVTIDGKEYKIIVTDSEKGNFGALQNMINFISSPGTLKLDTDYEAQSGEGPITIESGKSITIDLNGHTIDRGLKSVTSSGNVITVKGTLTVEDNSTAGTGKITGGNNTADGGGVIVDGGSFIFKGGSITGNTTNSSGGGVKIKTNLTFTMNGGNITENTASANGGGVYVSSGATFIMNSGNIVDNKASGSNSSGGGVYMDSTFIMNGGNITENKAGSRGGGVYKGNEKEMTVGGTSQISGNLTGSTTNNVYLLSGNYITIATGDNKPQNGMSIGVTTNASPAKDKRVKITTNGTTDDVKYFSADNDAYEVKLNENYLELAVKTTPSHTHTFAYAASNNKLTATCTAECDEDYYTNPLTLTLTAPKNLVYDGNPKGVAFTNDEVTRWRSAGLTPPDIMYYVKQSGQSTYMPLLGELISPGDYKAQTTVNGATAELEFAIKKATPYIKSNPVPSDIVYGKKLADSTLSGGYAQVSSTDSTQVRGSFEWTKPNTKPAVSDSNKTLYSVTFTPENNNYDTVTCQVTITVIEQEKSLIVTFIYRNGQENHTVEVPYNGTVSEPTAPVMEGYAFDAWCSDNKCRTKYDFSELITDNLPLYARWTKNAGTDGNVRTEDKVVEIMCETENPEERELIADIKKNTSGSIESADSLADAVKNKVKEEATKNGKDVILFIDTQLTGIKVEKGKTGETEKATTTLTYDATPWMSTIGSDGKVKETRKIDNNDLNGNITLRLPVPASITEKYVNIVHESDGYPKKTYKNLEIVNQRTDKAYVEINISHFSSFELTFSNEKSIDPVPYNGNSGSGSTSELFTGRPGNPVTNGTWNYYPAIDKWTYTTSRKFTNTWAYIANPYAGNEAAWFYFDEYGYMLTGWHKLYWNGAYRWFYFIETKDAKEGKCQLGGITPDGHKLGADGAWIEK